MLALYLAFLFELEAPASAALTVSILALPTRGQGLEKAGFRITATILGVAVCFAMIGVFAQTGALLLIVLSLWMGACVYAAGLLDGNRAYAAALGAVTVAFVAVQNLDTPQSLFDAGFARGAAIVIGILSIAVVNDLLAAPDNYLIVEGKLRDLHRRVAAYGLNAASTTRDTAEEAARLLRDIASLRADIMSLFAESSAGRARRSAARATLANLVAYVAEARVQKLNHSVGENPALLVALRDDLAGAQLLQARDREVSECIEALRFGKQPPRELRTPFCASRRIAFENGLAAAATFFLAAMVLMALGWPAAELSLSFVGILIGLSATAPDRRAFATLALIAAPLGCLLAGILKFFVLDGVSDFPLLALGFAPFVIALCLLATVTHPVVSTLARTELTFLIAILQPSNPQGYDTLSFLFISFFVCLAAALIFVTQLLFPPMSPRSRLRVLLKDMRGDLRATVPARVHLLPEELLFRQAVRVGQIADAAAATQNGGATLNAAVAGFDHAATRYRVVGSLFAEAPLRKAPRAVELETPADIAGNSVREGKP